MPDLYASKRDRAYPMRPKRNPRQGGGKSRPNKNKGGGGGGGSNSDFLIDPLSPRQFRRERRADIRLQTRPLQRQLRSEYLASQHRENQQIPAYFADYQKVLQGNQAANQGAYDSALERVAQFSQQAGAQDQAGRAEIMQRLAADAARRGTTVDPSVDLGQQGAESARMNLQTSVLGTLAGQGANQFAYLGNRQGIAKQQEGAERQNEYMRRKKITEDQRELAKQKGDLGAQYRTIARESERKFYLENKALKNDITSGRAEERGRNYRARLAALTSKINNAADNAADAVDREDKQKWEAIQARLEAKRDRIKDRKDRKFDARQGKKDRKARAKD